ncbi:MAG: hypothetical protein PF436_08480 [Prolixibacteraceae bacterium]|jgi:hypothetical protein|nr:hypothetical protein [Prolixibacteraceae bacterium]
MDNKIIIQLIKQEVEELRLLVNALDKQDDPHGVLVDVTKSKIQTLVKVSGLLHENGAQKADSDSDIKDDVLQKTIIDSIVENNLEDEQVVPDNILKTEPVAEEKEPEPDQEILVENVEKEVSLLNQESENEPPIEKTSNTVPSSGEQPLNSKTEQVATVNEQEDLEEQKETDTPEVEDKPKHMVLGERFTKDQSLNEKFTTLSESKYKIMGKPVTSVKKSIGLNDRFMFTRELFNNDSEKYNITVEAIDKANNFVEAIEYLEENCKWPKSETSLKFMNLVKRRFDN